MTCGWIKAAIAGVGFLAAGLAPTQGQALCVGCTCTTTATGMNFGAYNLLSPSNLQSSGSIRVQCTLVLAVAGSYTIELSPGSSGTYAQRTLRNGASSLDEAPGDGLAKATARAKDDHGIGGHAFPSDGTGEYAAG